MFERRIKGNAVIALLVMVVGILILYEVFHAPVYRLFSDFLSPYLKVPSLAGDAVSQVSGYAKSRQALLEERSLLLAELNELRPMRHELTSLRENYNALCKLNHLPPLPHYRYVRAQIVLRDPASWGEKMTINCGADAGIYAGAPVLTLSLQTRPDGSKMYQLVVIGRVSETLSNNTAVVETLLSSDCALSVFMPASEAAGILCGGHEKGTESYLNLSHLPLERLPKAGDAVYTSGLSDYTPRGLLVGHIQHIHDTQGNSNGQLYGEGVVRLAADIQALHYVVVPVREKL